MTLLTKETNGNQHSFTLHGDRFDIRVVAETTRAKAVDKVARALQSSDSKYIHVEDKEGS